MFANPAEIWYETLAVVTKPKEELTVTEWAERYRWFAQGESFKSQHGNAPYEIEDAPFQREPENELLNDKIQLHVWMMASRIAKTASAYEDDFT